MSGERTFRFVLHIIAVIVWFSSFILLSFIVGPQNAFVLAAVFAVVAVILVDQWLRKREGKATRKAKDQA